MKTLNNWIGMAAAGAALATGPIPAASSPTLVGDTVAFWVQAQSSGNLVLDSFAIVTSVLPEFVDQIDLPVPIPLSSLNIEATSIRLDALNTFFSPYFGNGNPPSYYEIRDLDFVGEPGRVIVGVDVSFSPRLISVDDSSPMDWPAFSADQVTFTDHSVRISFGGYRFEQDAFVHVDLITGAASVPTPGTAALVIAGGMAAAALRRRRRSGLPEAPQAALPC